MFSIFRVQVRTSAGGRGWANADRSGQGGREGQFWLIFCRRPLWMTPNGDEMAEHLLLLCPKWAAERQRYFGDSIKRHHRCVTALWESGGIPHLWVICPPCRQCLKGLSWQKQQQDWRLRLFSVSASYASFKALQYTSQYLVSKLNDATLHFCV